ncbi:DinB family protein [Herpetosiphon llansteffanensis]|uniref:DinB family protein n=1 Tax=Herpetosiphon llansteffanensis TaxID=2094568 RepID=UPI0013E0A6D2|nr:DinB family protein [Herpetosiphon llansteffanensis]
MDSIWKISIWQQYGAALAMLDDGITRCPDQLWTLSLWHDADDQRYGQFWFVAYHTLFWTDLLLTGTMEGFAPPPPFIRGKLPDQPYSKADVLSYLAVCRQRCQTTIEALTEAKAKQICVFEWMQISFLELIFYSMRHIQEHAAQLSLVLGQQHIPGADWIPRASANHA